MISSSSDQLKLGGLPHLTEGDEAFRQQFVSWDLGNLTITDIEAYLAVKDLILVPVASLEQHGPHLPLYTDTITAVEISRRVAEHIAVLHTPPIWMGYSPQHMHEPGRGRGTITMRSSTLLAVMHDTARSLIHHGFNRIVFINGHGSNIKVVDPVLRQLRYETGALIGFVKPYMERYTGILEGLMENPPEETPGWHASAWSGPSSPKPTFRPSCPSRSRKKTGCRTWSSRATSTSPSRWTTTSSSRAASSATRCGPPRRKGRRPSAATPSTSRAGCWSWRR